jgi:adenylosuccinate synthase
MAVGTTKKGIGPAYSTKMTRSGLRMCDVFDEENFEKKLRRLAMGYQKRFGDLLKYDVEEEIKRYKVFPRAMDFMMQQLIVFRTFAENSLHMSSIRSPSSHRRKRRTQRSWWKVQMR